jgi:hypothetical protein
MKFTSLRAFNQIITGQIKSLDDRGISPIAHSFINHILFSILNEDKCRVNHGQVLVNKHIDEPFLPLMKDKHYNYTLVLDLDETLIHYFAVKIYSNLFRRRYPTCSSSVPIFMSF